MSNEEQVADTIEMLYQRLNSYNKQDLFNYGYLLESNQILCKDIEEKDKEIERLNNIIDELKEDIEFCLKSIKQECEMSTDERTRIEMESCKQILEERLKEGGK